MQYKYADKYDIVTAAIKKFPDFRPSDLTQKHVFVDGQTQCGTTIIDRIVETKRLEDAMGISFTMIMSVVQDLRDAYRKHPYAPA